MIRVNINGNNGGGGKRVLISIGLTLILFSLCLYAYPKFFSYIFSGLFGLLGLGALLNGIFSKPRQRNSNNNDTEDGTYHELND